MPWGVATRLLDVSAGHRYETVIMTAAEFVALDPAEPKNHRGFRSPGLSCLKSIYLYFSGLWLGDGTRCNATISNNHQVEIKDFLVQHAAELGLHLVWHKGLSYATAGRKTCGSATI